MKNFKRLSAKQIKTYATVVLISTMSLQALGWVSEKEASPNAGMTSSYEMKLDNELVIENWMVTPFFSDIDMESTWSVPAAASYENELVIETWMTVPFEIRVKNEIPAENSNCRLAP
jgi:hypothetical protein